MVYGEEKGEAEKLISVKVSIYKRDGLHMGCVCDNGTKWALGIAVVALAAFTYTLGALNSWSVVKTRMRELGVDEFLLEKDVEL